MKKHELKQCGNGVTRRSSGGKISQNPTRKGGLKAASAGKRSTSGRGVNKKSKNPDNRLSIYLYHCNKGLMRRKKSISRKQSAEIKGGESQSRRS